MDADPQGDLTTCLGWKDTDELLITISDKLLSVIMDKNENPFDGILLTLVDGRTNLAKSTVEALRGQFGSHIRIYRTTIPIAVKAAEV